MCPSCTAARRSPLGSHSRRASAELHCRPVQTDSVNQPAGDHSRGPQQGTTAGDPSRGPQQGTTAGDHSRGPQQGTTAGDHSRGPQQGTAAGDPSRGPQQGTTAGDHSRGPQQGTAAGDRSRGPQQGTTAGDRSRGPQQGTTVQFTHIKALVRGKELGHGTQCHSVGGTVVEGLCRPMHKKPGGHQVCCHLSQPELQILQIDRP